MELHNHFGGVVPELASRAHLVNLLPLVDHLLERGEVKLSDLIERGRADRRYRALPTFPAAPRDLAIVIDEAVRVGEMVARVDEVAGALAEEVRIFDLYAGKQVGKGKKSVGVAIVYHSPERSLEGGEVDKIQQDIVAMLKREFNAEIREK